MKLIAIAPNLLVNPDFISSVEQKKNFTYVVVGGKEYILKVPMKDFYQSMGIAEQSSGEQHFAG